MADNEEEQMDGIIKAGRFITAMRRNLVSLFVITLRIKQKILPLLSL